MKSKADLRVEIGTLAEQHTLEVPAPEALDALNHMQLTELLEGLKAKVAPPAPPPSTDSESAPAPLVSGVEEELGGPPPPGGVKYRHPFTVKAGHSVAGTHKGTIPAFGRIRALDLPGGEAALAELVASGVVHDKKLALP